MTRRLSLALLVTLATPWAILLTLGGLWLLFVNPTLGGVSAMPRFILGLSAWAAGQLVFMCLVADRVFPLASKRAVWWIEIFTAGVLVGCIVWLMVVLGGS